MTEEKARADAEALASALGITFFVVRTSDGQFATVQSPSEESEIIAAIGPPTEQRSLDDVPPAEDRSLDDVRGFGKIPPRN